MAVDKDYASLRSITKMANVIKANYALKSVFTGASQNASGVSGLVPAPIAGDQSKFLRADGSWALPTTYTLSSFGITVSSTKINYLSGVTSDIQTQLNDKAAASHNHDTVYVKPAGKLNKTFDDTALISAIMNS